APFDAGQPANDSQVVGIHAIAVKLVELAADGADVVECIRTMGMAGELRDLPGSEARKNARGELPALRLEASDFLLDVDLGLRGDVLELLDFCFELGDRLFEIQKGNGHESFYRKSKCCARVRAGTAGRKIPLTPRPL